MRFSLKNASANKSVRAGTLLVVCGFLSFAVFYVLASTRVYDARRALVTSSQCEAAACVELTKLGARPAELTIQAGSSVQFIGADGQEHQIALGEGGKEHKHSGGPHSPTFTAGQTWRTQLNEAGIFYFHDHLHPELSVRIDVQAKN